MCHQQIFPSVLLKGGNRFPDRGEKFLESEALGIDQPDRGNAAPCPEALGGPIGHIAVFPGKIADQFSLFRPDLIAGIVFPVRQTHGDRSGGARCPAGGIQQDSQAY